MAAIGVPLGRPRRGQVSGAVGRLHPKSAMGPAMVVGQVLVENPLSMLLVFDDDVVESVPAQGADHPLAEGVGRWRARWCGEESGAKSSDAAMEVGAIDRVSVVDEESGDLVGIAGRLRKALGGPAGAWVLGDAGVDDRAPAEGENDEDVKEAESPRDEDEEVAGPGLVQVVADEGSPALATLSVEVGRAVLRDGARGDLVAELGQFGGDDLLTPCRVLAPHPPDEFAEICVDGRTARRERQRQSRRQAKRCQPMTVSGFTRRTASRRRWKRPTNAPMIQRSNRRKRGRLIWRRTTMSCWRRIRFSAIRAARGATKARMMSNQKRRRAITVPPAYHDGRLLARRASVRGRVVGRGGRTRDGRRDSPVTVGDTGSDPGHYGVFAPHSPFSAIGIRGDIGRIEELVVRHLFTGRPIETQKALQYGEMIFERPQDVRAHGAVGSAGSVIEVGRFPAPIGRQVEIALASRQRRACEDDTGNRCRG
jgi:hypothetical protein